VKRTKKMMVGLALLVLGTLQTLDGLFNLNQLSDAAVGIEVLGQSSVSAAPESISSLFFVGLGLFFYIS